MAKPVLSDKGKLLIDFFGKKMMQGDYTNDDLVQFIEFAGDFLNLQTISDYAKSNNLSYNGVKNNREIVTLFNVKYVIDND
jgi:hypothetical protein